MKRFELEKFSQKSAGIFGLAKTKAPMISQMILLC